MNYAGETDFTIVDDGVKRAAKIFSATEHALNGVYFTHYASDLEKQTFVEIYRDDVEVGEI